MFDEQYAEMSNRPTFSLSYETAPGELLTFAPRAYPGRLPPFFSSLLPEGVLRELLIRRAGVRPSDEFSLIWALGADLPGAVRVVEHGAAVETATVHHPDSHMQEDADEAPLRFSLPGVQLKMSAVLAREFYQFHRARPCARPCGRLRRAFVLLQECHRARPCARPCGRLRRAFVLLQECHRAHPCARPCGRLRRAFVLLHKCGEPGARDPTRSRKAGAHANCCFCHGAISSCSSIGYMRIEADW